MNKQKEQQAARADVDRLSQEIKQHEAEVNTRMQQPPHCSPVASPVWWHRDLATQERAKKEALRKKNIAHRRELERQILASASRLDDPFFNMSDTERLVSHATPRNATQRHATAHTSHEAHVASQKPSCSVEPRQAPEGTH